MPSSSALHKTKPAASSALPKTARVVVEITQIGPITYQRELVKCGKAKCRRCRRRAAHGPYWYAYRWKPGKYGSMSEGRTVSKYIGKKLSTAKTKDWA